MLELTERCLPSGQVDLRVVATVPNTAGLYRLDQLIAAMARRSLWISDAYFVGVAPYVQALSAAARDGVDVRLLVPGTSDVPAVAAISRAGYRPLLEAGVRVFEWNGSMMHAKTAVADGRWARVGSSNLNLASWIGNCELDLAIEDEAFARCMEAQYESDLGNATEIVLKLPRRWRKSNTGAPAPESDAAAEASDAAPPPSADSRIARERAQGSALPTCARRQFRARGGRCVCASRTRSARQSQTGACSAAVNRDLCSSRPCRCSCAR